MYVPGTENILSDALLRLYAFDEPGTVHSRSEYTYHDIVNNDVLGSHLISMPVLVGMEGKGLNQVDAIVHISEDAMTVPAVNGVSNDLADGSNQAELDKSNLPINQSPNSTQSAAALAAGGMRPKRAYRQKVIPPVETGCLETSKEFAKQTTSHFVLKGPQQQKEGENNIQKKITI